MTKEAMKKQLEEDLKLSQGSLREILSHNRKINLELVKEFESLDYSHLEEYGLMVEGILKSVKLLNEVNGQAPKVVREIDQVKDEAIKIDLNDLIDE